LPFTKRRFYQIRDKERRNFSFERILFWQEQGLKLKEISKLAGASEATLTKMRKGEQDV
jgi:DNA-binding transcriptional MerR regulator